LAFGELTSKPSRARFFDKIPLPLDMHYTFGDMPLGLRQVLHQHFPFHAV
jgi:hypothetical protein